MTNATVTAYCMYCTVTQLYFYIAYINGGKLSWYYKMVFCKVHFIHDGFDQVRIDFTICYVVLLLICRLFVRRVQQNANECSLNSSTRHFFSPFATAGVIFNNTL